MRLSSIISGPTSIPVLALSSPGWSDFFYANLEVAQDNERGTVLQSTVDGHIITVDPQIISQFIGVPVLNLPASPFNEVVLPPSMDELQEFFHVVPQGEGHQTSIKIGALGPAHRMLAKIILHNLWPVTRRSNLILKKAQFVYAVHFRFPLSLQTYSGSHARGS
jgi:hypothetical protein